MQSTIKRVVHKIQHHFLFSRKEANAFVALTVLFALFLSIYICYAAFYPAHTPDPAVATRADSVSQELNALLYSSHSGDSDYHPDKTPCIPFNPNTASEEAMIRCGMPKFLAGRIVKYRSKGGKFRRKTDLLKIYGLDSALYNRIAASVSLPQAPTAQLYVKNNVQAENKKSAVAKIIRIDINTATEEEWRQIPGIGAVYAGRIVKYRALLGGFAGTNQLKEVYGIPDSVLAAPQVELFVAEDFTPAKLNLNGDDFKTLLRHPYLEMDEVKCICNYRKKTSEISALTDSCISAKAAQIMPYLK